MAVKVILGRFHWLVVALAALNLLLPRSFRYLHRRLVT